MKNLISNDLDASSALYGSLIEKIELLRSSMRWAKGLDAPEKQKLLNQVNALRSEIMILSRHERLRDAKDSDAQEKNKNKTTKKRRQDLIERSFVFEGVFGESHDLLESMEIAERAAPSDLPVLIDGESGTGKELMAKVVHTNGRRSDQAFISVNCGAIPENLIESELFGHKKGAFTGASADRAGKFESANGGTIFLDEVGELPLQGQVKLLRVLQSNEIQRVGSDQAVNIDTRIVAATNRNLLKMSQQGTFREDLFYRLSVIQITLPPLRERRDEIPLLVDFFAGEAAEKLERPPISLSSRLRNFLLKYEYPGNIRELRNLIFRVSCLADDTADIFHLPEHVRPTSTNDGKSDAKAMSLADVRQSASDSAEKAYLEDMLSQQAGNVTVSASKMAVNRSHLQSLLKKHGISSKDFKSKPKAGEE
jgi:transcriptional regulator with PAS, ATPase and Fis domain